MRILTLILAGILIMNCVSATSIINFYVSDNQVDAVGISEEILNLPFGLIQDRSKIYGTADLIEKQNGIWVFNFSTDSEIEINVYLPENTEIVEGEGYISVHDDKIIVSKTGKELYFKYDEAKDYTWIWIALFLLIFWIGFYLLIKRRGTRNMNKLEKLDKLKIIKDTLNERELKIISRLREYKKNNVKIKQNQLRKALDIPKASFSRHIQELEKKKIVKRIGEGKNKFVELS